MKESIQGGGGRRPPPPCVEAARGAASFMDGCVAEAVAEAVAVAEVVEGRGYYDLPHDDIIYEFGRFLIMRSTIACYLPAIMVP